MKQQVSAFSSMLHFFIVYVRVLAELLNKLRTFSSNFERGSILTGTSVLVYCGLKILEFVVFTLIQFLLL